MPFTPPDPPEKWSQGWGNQLTQALNSTFQKLDATMLLFKKNFAQRYTQPGFTATGTNQATAALIVGDLVEVTTATTTGMGVVCPSGRKGMQIWIANAGAGNAFNVYPAVGETMDGGTNAPVLLGTSKRALITWPANQKAYSMIGGTS